MHELPVNFSIRTTLFSQQKSFPHMRFKPLKGALNKVSNKQLSMYLISINLEKLKTE